MGQLRVRNTRKRGVKFVKLYNQNRNKKNLWPNAFFLLCIQLGVLYPEHLQLAFDCVIIAGSLESIRPGLYQGCKAPNGVG